MNSAEPRFTFSARFAAAYPEFSIATLAVSAINRSALASRLQDIIPARLAASQSNADILQRVSIYERFFKQFGVSSPLRRQLKTTHERGLPNVDGIVRALLLSEMTTGILMGAHDIDAIHGLITFDIAGEGESFEGMRNVIRCHENEIVARDDAGIIFSYLQGADKRTCIREETKSVVYFAFGAPSLDIQLLGEALSSLADVVGDAGVAGSSAIHTPTVPTVGVDQARREEICLEPTCKNPGRFRLTRKYRTGSALVLAACRDHTDRFQELVLAVKYGDAVNALIERIEL